MQQYGRQYILQVGNESESIRINNLRVKFKIKHTHDKKPNHATFSIYNLNPTHRNLITQKQYTKVALLVGYGTLDDCRLLYAGQISKPKTLREDMDFVTELECDDGATDYRNAFMSVTLSAGSTHGDIIEQCLKTMPNVQPGVIGVDSDVTLTRGRVCYGSTRSVIGQIANHHDADWSIQNGRLIILKADYCQPGEAAVISQKTGMIKSPRVTNGGMEVSCLLNPMIQVGGLIRIDSIVDDYDGDYKVTTIESNGDTHGEDWTSVITAVNGKFKKAKKVKKSKKKKGG